MSIFATDPESSELRGCGDVALNSLDLIKRANNKKEKKKKKKKK